MHTVYETQKSLVFVTGFHYVAHAIFYYIHKCIHTYIYKIITYETKKHAIKLFGGRITLGPSFYFGDPVFFQTNGVPGPCFFNP